MKKLRTYTLRGAFSCDVTGETKKIDIFDGEYDKGIRVTKFQVFPMDPIFANTEVTGFLATADPRDRAIANPERVWDWNDPTQIAWAYSEDTLQNHDFIDPSNLVIEDLYVSITSGSTVDCGYLMIVEQYELSPYQSSLAIVGNRSQG
jgi:hypothetical protein